MCYFKTYFIFYEFAMPMSRVNIQSRATTRNDAYTCINLSLFRCKFDRKIDKRLIAVEVCFL